MTVIKKIKPIKKPYGENLMLLGMIIAIIVIMSILEPRRFLRAANMRGMFIQLPEYGIMCYGMMIAMISGGIDLSLVGIANLSSIIGACFMLANGGSPVSIIIAVCLSLIVGLCCGLINGFLIGYLKIPAMLVTLCGLQLYEGLGLAITKGPALTGLPESFSMISNGRFLGIPIPFYVFMLITCVMAFIMRSTVYGQELKFLGTNETASKYSGVNTVKVTVMTYAIGGILSALSGILISSHYNSAKSNYGSSYTMLTLLIVVLGGTNPNGGEGNVFGVMLAVFVLQLISSAFNLRRVNSFVATFVFGIILVITVLISKYIEERKEKE